MTAVALSIGRKFKISKIQTVIDLPGAVGTHSAAALRIRLELSFISAKCCIFAFSESPRGKNILKPIFIALPFKS